MGSPTGLKVWKRAVSSGALIGPRYVLFETVKQTTAHWEGLYIMLCRTGFWVCMKTFKSARYWSNNNISTMWAFVDKVWHCRTKEVVNACGAGERAPSLPTNRIDYWLLISDG